MEDVDPYWGAYPTELLLAWLGDYVNKPGGGGFEGTYPGFHNHYVFTCQYGWIDMDTFSLPLNGDIGWKTRIILIGLSYLLSHVLVKSHNGLKSWDLQRIKDTAETEHVKVSFYARRSSNHQEFWHRIGQRGGGIQLQRSCHALA